MSRGSPFWHHEAGREMTNGDPEGRIFSVLSKEKGRDQESLKPSTTPEPGYKSTLISIMDFFLAHNCLYLIIFFFSF